MSRTKCDNNFDDMRRGATTRKSRFIHLGRCGEIYFGAALDRGRRCRFRVFSGNMNCSQRRIVLVDTFSSLAAFSILVLLPVSLGLYSSSFQPCPAQNALSFSTPLLVSSARSPPPAIPKL